MQRFKVATAGELATARPPGGEEGVDGGVVLFAPDACPGGLTLAETAILPSAFRCRKELEIASACANGGGFKPVHDLSHF